MERIRNKLSQKVSFYEEILNYGKDGEEYWLSLNITPIFDEAGKLANFIAVESDITEQKEREKELENQKRETDALVHSIGTSNFLIEFSPQGTITSANKGFLETFGYDEAEIVGKHHRILCDSTYANSIEYKRFWEKLNQGLFDEGVYKRYGKENQEIWLQATYNPIQDNTGKVTKIVKFATDVTERRERNAENRGKLRAIESSTGVIEFNLDGTIIKANDIFLDSLGYTKEEVEGKHHRIFASDEYAQSQEYHDFWQKLNRGAFVEGEFPRVSKDGKEVWFRATYNPIKNDEGEILKVVKYAYDITAEKQKEVELALQKQETDSLLSAIEKSNLVIEFTPDGNIIHSDDGFLKALGYSANELFGKHHSFMCEPSYVKSEEYRQFWQKLGNGEFEQGVYKRISKDGKAIWLQATYNPIKDENGKVKKIVKFATDVTQRRNRNAENRGKLRAIESSTGVIEFNLDGTIITANDIFLKSLGYSLEEVQGKHHQIFASEEYANSEEYKRFWQKLNRGEFVEGEFQRLSKNGETVWFSATYSPIKNDEGELLKVVKYAFDITERKAGEKELEKLAMVANSTNNAVIITNPKGEIEYVNQAFTDITEYVAEEVIGMKPGTFLQGPDTDQDTVARIREKLTQKVSFYEEILNYGKHGRPYWLGLNITPVLGDDGEVKQFLAVESDITEQKEREQDLQEAFDKQKEQQIEIKKNAEFVQKIFDISQDGLVVMEGSALTETNQAFLELVGAENEEEVIGKTPIDFSPESKLDGSISAETILPLIGKVIEEGRIFFQWQLQNKQKQLIDVEINGVLVEMRGDLPVMQFTIRDVTDQKKSREAIAKSEQNFRQITRATPGMLFKLENDEKGNLGFSYVSEFSDELFEVSAQSFVEDMDYLWATIHPDDLPVVYEQLEEAVRTRNDWSSEFRIITPSNVYKWLRLEAKNDGSSESFGNYGIIRDVTNRKKAQLRVQRQNEILETLTKYDEQKLTLNSALGAIAKSTAMAIEAGRVSIWTFGEDKEELTTTEVFQIKSTNNAQKEIKLNRRNFPTYFSEIDKGKAVIANNVKNSSVFSQMEDGYLKQNNIVATINVPIKFRGDVIGVLCCESIGESRNWKEEEIEFAQSIADASTLAFEARRQEKIQTRIGSFRASIPPSNSCSSWSNFQTYYSRLEISSV